MERSNRDQVVARLRSDVVGIGFHGVGRDGRLSGDVQKVIAQVIVDRTINRREDASNAPLAPLKPATIARKLRLGFPETILVETGHMLAEEQLLGELAVDENHAIEIAYGKDEYAELKAEWAHIGGPNRPERTFFAIGNDEQDHAAIDGTIHRGLDMQAKLIWG